MKCTILLTCACLCQSIYAQKIHLNTFVGVANYDGDLQPKRFTFNQAKFAFGAGLSYELSDKIFIRSELRFARVGADDKFNSKYSVRNLNFTSKIYDGQLVSEYYFRNLYDYTISPYVFAGIGIYHFNPTTKDTAGNKIYLQPLSTEGEGFYQNRKVYNLIQLSIPFGGGIKFALNKNIRAGIEISMRKLFTDYLDDVSTTYVDKNLLLNNRGVKAVELAFRGNGTYPPDGSPRGSSKHKDWYYFMGITTSFRIVWTETERYHSKTGCPASVN